MRGGITNVNASDNVFN